MQFQTLDEWLGWQESFHPRTVDLGLARVRKVFQQIEPGYRKPFTITVAGTNGKGSCIAFLASVLIAQGYRVGAYTSPHLLRYNERIQINGEPVSDAVICNAFERVNTARKNVSLTYFEFGTLAALDIFSESGVDIQLLEVGLGGRLDAVNILDADITLITCIEIDHVDWLGESREAIGREKAGVFRCGVPAVLGEASPPLSMIQYAEANQVPVYRYGQDFFFDRGTSGWNWRSETEAFNELPLPALAGEHQLQNAAAVLQVLSLASRQFPVSSEAIQEGLRSVRLSGRYQYIEGTPPVLMDVAHNPQAAKTLAEFIRDNYPGRRILAVFSIMSDKDIAGVVESIRDVVSYWFLAPLEIARCADESEVIEVFTGCGIDAYASGFGSFPEAFDQAAGQAGNDDIILIFGSFFLVAEFLKRSRNTLDSATLALAGNDSAR